MKMEHVSKGFINEMTSASDIRISKNVHTDGMTRVSLEKEWKLKREALFSTRSSVVDLEFPDEVFTQNLEEQYDLRITPDKNLWQTLRQILRVDDLLTFQWFFDQTNNTAAVHAIIQRGEKGKTYDIVLGYNAPLVPIAHNIEVIPENTEITSSVIISEDNDDLPDMNMLNTLLQDEELPPLEVEPEVNIPKNKKTKKVA